MAATPITTTKKGPTATSTHETYSVLAGGKTHMGIYTPIKKGAKGKRLTGGILG